VNPFAGVTVSAAVLPVLDPAANDAELAAVMVNIFSIVTGTTMLLPA
jgi:tRNA G10  N-methylase Trm11